MLRVACDASDAGAEVEINGKFRGECPIDVQVPAGTLQLLVRKKVAADQERVFAQDVRMGEDSIKKIEVQLGAPQMSAQAFAAVRKGAEKGEPESMYRFGNLYAEGISLPKDRAEAIVWYRKAADAGYGKAMLSLASAYTWGRGVTKDLKQAEVWYQKAADSGNSDGMTHLYDCYKDGKCGLQRNQELAEQWIRKAIAVQSKAAQAGDASAMSDLGFEYLLGRGVTQDEANAALWFRRAAEAGNMNAMWYLGSLYRDGKGVPQNKEQAIHWYRKAAALGDSMAKEELVDLGVR
jgi:hypothetical protein